MLKRTCLRKLNEEATQKKNLKRKYGLSNEAKTTHPRVQDKESIKRAHGEGD